MASYKLSINAAFLWMFQRENDPNSSKAPHVNITRDNVLTSIQEDLSPIAMSTPTSLFANHLTKGIFVEHVFLLFVAYSLNECSY